MKLSKILITRSIVPSIWTLSTILYLGRSLAEPLKYIFIICFGILLTTYTWFYIKETSLKGIIKYLAITKEFQILGLFVIFGILLSSPYELLSIKSIINFLGILLLLFIYYNLKEHIRIDRLYRGWIILTVIIGIVGLLKWLNIILDFHDNWFSSFYQRGTSLVPDYNFFSGYFILSIIIYFFCLSNSTIKTKPFTNQAILVLFTMNILLTGSRRGIIIFVFLTLAGFVILYVNRRDKRSPFYKALAIHNIFLLSFFIIGVILIPFRSKIISDNDTRRKIVDPIYRYSTIFSPTIGYKLTYEIVWPRTDKYKFDKTNWDKYATYNNIVSEELKYEYQDLKEKYWSQFEKNNPKNLIYNGDFQYGSKLWRIDAPDSVTHEIISTEYGNAIRVRRLNGLGYWPLRYDGRKIAYHKDLTYTYKFKYRVVKGNKVPFMIGWWVDEGEGHINRLPYRIKSLENGWFEYTTSYKFKNDQSDLATFMNSQQANSVVDFTDIELTSDDSKNQPKFEDQKFQVEGVNLFYNSNFKHGLEYWDAITKDTIKHELIETKYGKALRVIRNVGSGYWPLVYKGREIYYFKNRTYYFRFKYRVIQGEGVPFNIGWWLPEETPNPYSLHKDVFPINDDWFECIASYTFKKDHYGKITTFMNTQKPNTVIDFTDIELICNNASDLPKYVDENIDMIQAFARTSLDLPNDTVIVTQLTTRTDRWKYALELWQSEYSGFQKLFGGGFDYLRKFGNRFYPTEDRIDYPHNPIISSFLYSGLIGGLFYIYFLVLSFVYYWKYRKHHMLLFILYIIIFVFVFISSDSHFNVPIFAMLSLVPFITRSIVKEKEQKNQL